MRLKGSMEEFIYYKDKWPDEPTYNVFYRIGTKSKTVWIRGATGDHWCECNWSWNQEDTKCCTLITEEEVFLALL